MGKLSDLVSALRDMDEMPESMFDDIDAAGQFDLDEAGARISQLEQERIDADANSAAAIAEHVNTINSLKARNYDLVRSLPVGDNSGGGTASDESVNGTQELEEPEQATIADVFTERD